jgi:hypothetical protein
MNLGLGDAQKFYLGNQEVSKILLQDKEAYRSTWDVGIQTTNSNQTFAISLFGISQFGGPNLTVDWGDGTVETFITVGNKIHTYSIPGNYIIKISGNFTSNLSDAIIKIGNTTEQSQIVYSTSIIPLIPGLRSFVSTFLQTSLTSIPSDIFSKYTDIIDFSSTFNSTLLTSIPSGIFSTNPDVTSFFGTFGNCSSLSYIPQGLFHNNTAATNFAGTFINCNSITTVPSDLFANNVAATTFNFVFFGVTLTTESYSNLLINMASNAASRLDNVPFHGGNSKYNLAGQAAKQTLEGKGWVFTDGGLE